MFFEQTEPGGTLRLTCGAFGSGKTYITVKHAEEAKKSGIYRKIYSNIRGHAELCEGITPLPDDWRECEPYSLIIIDEVQSYEKFSLYFSKRKDEEIVDITMMRHNHHDIWMTSPDPGWVNTAIRKLVNLYIFCEATGDKTSKAWCFTRAKNEVTKTIKQTAHDEFTFSIEEKYYSLYKSTKDGKASGRAFHRNWKLIGFVLGLAFVVFIAILLMGYLTKSTKSNVDALVDETKKKGQEQGAKAIETDLFAAAKQKHLTDVDCRKGVNVDKPECIEYFNRISRSGESVGVAYNPSKPYEDSEIQDNLTYQVTAKPVFSGCMKTGSKYQAYTQQGTKLDVSQADCERLIQDNDRPFNYFASSSKEQIKGFDQANDKSIANNAL